MKWNKMGIPLNEIFDKDTIFYSWQSDRDADVSKLFIRKAINKAIQKLKSNFAIEEDMRGTSGTPILTDVLFSKIDKSYIVIADVSFCVKSKIRSFPNPNVLIELGYASKSIGWERVITVMNECWGKADKLPVDIKDRRHPIVYNLKSMDDEKYNEELKQLSNSLYYAISSAIDNILISAEDAIRKLDGPSLSVLKEYLTKKNDNYPTYENVNNSKNEMDYHSFSIGCSRLIDLNIIRTSHQTYANKYTYYLTRKGRIVSKYLGLIK